MTNPNTAVLCLPFAGAGASFFNDWHGRHPALEVLPVQLPGREKRFAEPCFEDVELAAADVVAGLADRTDTGGALVVFGHSLGAVLAFEVARMMLARPQGPQPTRLIVSGSPDPWNQREAKASGLDDEQFLSKVMAFSDYSHSALGDPLMRELLLPTLRADVQMHESYVPRHRAVLDLDIVTVRGRDDALVSAQQVKGWRQASSRRVTHVEFSGGHMFFADNARPLLDFIAQVESTPAQDMRCAAGNVR